jgi:hypothetical protein
MQGLRYFPKSRQRAVQNMLKKRRALPVDIGGGSTSTVRTETPVRRLRMSHYNPTSLSNSSTGKSGTLTCTLCPLFDAAGCDAC